MYTKVLIIFITIIALITIPLMLLSVEKTEENQNSVQNFEQNGDYNTSLSPDDRIAQNTVQTQSQIQKNAGDECIVENRIGVCSEAFSSCAEGFLGPGTGNCGANKICCVEEQTSSTDLQCPSDTTCYVSSCPQGFEETGGRCDISAGGNTGAGYCCREVSQGDEDNENETDPGNRGGTLPGNQPGETIPPNDPNNFCKEEVTCGECNMDCLSGPGKCQICATDGNTCSYQQACSDDPQDPIFGQTCGKGEFTDNTRKKRKEGHPNYQHVSCQGTSVCTGGPNAEGLYWCIEELIPPDAKNPGRTCDLGSDHQPDTSCPSNCAKFNACSDGTYRKERCDDESLCAVNSPNPSPDPDPRASKDFPSVTNLNPSSNKGTTTSSKITLKISGEADKYNVYIHRGNPAPGDQVDQRYDPANVPTTKFALLGTTSLNQLTFNSPTQIGTYKIAVNAMFNASSSSKEIVCSWHNDVYERNSNGSLSQLSGSCDNKGTINFTVEQGSNSSQGTSCETTSTKSGLALTACTSQNCGGDVLLTWTAPTANNPWKYFLYRGTNSSFKPSGSNLIRGEIGEAMQSPPFHDWEAEPGKEYYYKVLAYDGKDGSGNITSDAARVFASAACGN